MRGAIGGAASGRHDYLNLTEFVRRDDHDRYIAALVAEAVDLHGGQRILAGLQINADVFAHVGLLIQNRALFADAFFADFFAIDFEH